MNITVGQDIDGLDAYPELKTRGRFPTKTHIFVECPRQSEVVDIIFTRKGRPLCLSILDRNMCDLCWAKNLLHNSEARAETNKEQILDEALYWRSVKDIYIMNKSTAPLHDKTS